MLVLTTWNAPGYEVREVKGEVFGLVVRSRSVVMNLAAMLRSLFGGEIRAYTELLEQSRQQAIDRMIENARGRGANAVLSMRFDASQIAGTMTEIVAYGTAVVLEPEPGPVPPAMPPRR
jgi:uncharacterized protein YbjQ (UPF0145 family)